MKDKKERIVWYLMLKATTTTLLFGLAMAISRYYLLGTNNSIETVVVILLFAAGLLYVFNRSLYAVYKLWLIRKAILANESFHDLTKRERFTHNLMLAPFVILLTSGVLLVFNHPLQFALLGFFLYIQVFVGNLSSFRYKQIYLPYYLKDTASQNM